MRSQTNTFPHRSMSVTAAVPPPAAQLRARSDTTTNGRVRRLTWRECAALQGFPSEWAFTGTTSSRFRQIGNAVQAHMANVIGTSIMASLNTRRPADLASDRWPDEFLKRIRYTAAEHKTNGEHRVRIKVAGVA